MADDLAKLGLAAVAVVGGASVVEWASDQLRLSKHDRLVKKTAKYLDRHASADASLRVDHGVGIGGGQPATIGDPRPDITLADFPTHLAIEVETESSLGHEARSQPEAFAGKQGYKPVLVVPASAKPQARSFVDAEVDSNVEVASPTEVL